MKVKLLFAFALVPVLFLAADKLTPPNAKLGLWETTNSHQMTGVPPIPPDVLAKMPPDQRARIEAAFKQRAAPASETRQSCLTQEKLDKGFFVDQRQSCQRTITSSTPTLAEFHEECTNSDGSTGKADGKFEFPNPTNMKGSMQITATTAKGQTMNMKIDVVGKWVSSDCGAVKN